MADGKEWSQHLLIMLIADQLGLANSDVFGQGILEIGQGKVSEKSGNFTFYSLWEPWILCLYNVDTLNICMKEFIIFVCTDSTEIFLSKLRSSCSNYNLPSFFSDSYCAGGI